jgi:hypothetical protein
MAAVVPSRVLFAQTKAVLNEPLKVDSGRGSPLRARMIAKSRFVRGFFEKRSMRKNRAEHLRGFERHFYNVLIAKRAGRSLGIFMYSKDIH